jgi:hypothetical protein
MAKLFHPHPAQYWHKLDDGRIQCDLCPLFHQFTRGSACPLGRASGLAPAATLSRAPTIAIKNGVRSALTGTFTIPPGRSTTAITEGADWPRVVQITSWQLIGDSGCKNCGSACPGRFRRWAGTSGGSACGSACAGPQGPALSVVEGAAIGVAHRQQGDAGHVDHGID